MTPRGCTTFRSIRSYDGDCRCLSRTNAATPGISWTIAIAAARAGRGADFVIEDPNTEIALGWVGLHRQDGDAVGCGYWLAADARGRGLMAQALRAACQWALTPPPAGLGAQVVRWQAHVGNDASRAVAEHVGFCIQPGTVPRRNSDKWTGILRA